jgi:predicted CxxxxCH...CXXCH cytochrome family protein
MQLQPSKGTLRKTPLAHERAASAFAACLIAVSFASTLGSCERSALPDGLPETQDCSSCHGSRANAAPPRSVNGSLVTTDIGVGAHQSHLVASHVAGPVPCTECHQLPMDLLSHPDPQPRPAAIVFGPKARLYGAEPVWDRASATCADVYCHGAKLSDAARRARPVWTSVDGRQRSCDSCHGNPPAGEHPRSDACDVCHGEVVKADGTIGDVTRHIDGIVDFYVVPLDAGAVSVGGASASGPTTFGAGGGT